MTPVAVGEVNSGRDSGETPGGVCHVRAVGQSRGEDSLCPGGPPGVREDEQPHERDPPISQGARPWSEGQPSTLSSQTMSNYIESNPSNLDTNGLNRRISEVSISGIKLHARTLGKERCLY